MLTQLNFNIESLISNSEPSLSQVLLSLNIYRKIVSSETMADLQRPGPGLPYTETIFIEDKWKNKIFNGRETHTTNSMITQQEYVMLL